MARLFVVITDEHVSMLHYFRTERTNVYNSEKERELYERKSIILIPGTQALPARHSDKNIIKAQMLVWLVAKF